MLTVLQMALTALVSFILAASAAPAPAASSSNCQEVKFTVSGSAQNRDLTGLSLSDPDLAQLLSADPFNLIPVSGTQMLGGLYCPATVTNDNAQKLQMLFHGITTNRLYYNALGGSLGFPTMYQPQLYNYVEYQNAQGYPVLALDRLGNGASSHPDPVLVTQGPYEYALYHNLTTQVKAGTTGALPQAFANPIFVGHSYGSVVGNEMAHRYPTDFSTIVLTGFTKQLLPSLPGFTLNTPVPAAIENPARYGDLQLGYLAGSLQQPRTNSLFDNQPGTDFDPEVATLFFQREDVVSVGQFVSLYTDITETPEYTGRLLVVTGENDELFCGLGSTTLDSAKCGSLVADTQTLFPNAEYNYHVVNNSGHVLNLHYSAPETRMVIAEFLDGTNFSG